MKRAVICIPPLSAGGKTVLVVGALLRVLSGRHTRRAREAGDRAVAEHEPRSVSFARRFCGGRSGSRRVGTLPRSDVSEHGPRSIFPGPRRNEAHAGVARRDAFSSIFMDFRRFPSNSTDFRRFSAFFGSPPGCDNDGRNRGESDAEL